MPAISAGGAVPEPLPSIWIFTFGYSLRKVSAQSAIMLFIVSEPTLLMLPETPVAFWYAPMAESTLTAWAWASTAPSTRVAQTNSKRFMASLLGSRFARVGPSIRGSREQGVSPVLNLR